jgi:hypothetical protein
MQFSTISGTKKYYFENDVKAVAGRNLEGGRIVYKISKKHSIPSPTFFKGMLSISLSAEEVLILKKKTPFNMTSNDNIKTAGYMTTIQSTGLRPSANGVGRLVLHIENRSRRGG